MGQIFVKASMRAKAYTRNTNLSIGGKVLKRNTKLGRQVRKERVIGKLNKGMERADLQMRHGYLNSGARRLETLHARKMRVFSMK